MIWEYTWPVAWVVEAASREKFNDDDYYDFTIFHSLSSLDTLLQSNFSSRPVEIPSLLEKCLFLIPLQIYQESCWYTLKMYVLI